MAGLDVQGRDWLAWFPVDIAPEAKVVRRVRVVKTRWDHQPELAYFWCTYNTVGVWPGTDSNEWIEYIPDPTPGKTAFFDLWASEISSQDFR